MAKRHWAVFENQEKNRHLCSRLTIAAQKLYRLLSRKAISCITDAERNVLNIGLKKFRPGQSEPILVGGEKLLKPALGLMSDFRLRIDEIKGAEVVTSYTRWLASVETRGAEIRSLFSVQPELRAQWLESKKRLPEYVSQKPANLGLRSQYALSLYTLARKHVRTEGSAFRWSSFEKSSG